MKHLQGLAAQSPPPLPHHHHCIHTLVLWGAVHRVYDTDQSIIYYHKCTMYYKPVCSLVCMACPEHDDGEDEDEDECDEAVDKNVSYC